MAYATVTDLQDRVGEPRLAQLTDLGDPPVGLVDQAVAQKALDDASAEIDSYLVGRYLLPLAPAPAVLLSHCVLLAYARLMGSAIDEATADERKAVRDYLTLVARGQVNLTAPNAAPPVPGAGQVLFNAGSKVMGRESY